MLPHSFSKLSSFKANAKYKMKKYKNSHQSYSKMLLLDRLVNENERSNGNFTHIKKQRKRKISYVIFNVWFASCQEEYSAGLVVAVLAAEVQGREPAPVLDVGVGLSLAQNLKHK